MIHNACPLKYKRRILEGRKSRDESGALGAGQAMHAGLADWYRTSLLPSMSPAQRQELGLNGIRNAWPVKHPVDDWRDLTKVSDVFRGYVKEYPTESFTVLGDANVPLVEIPFSIILPVTTDEGRKIVYGGIFDTLILWMGQVYILEHKTTSVFGSSYFNEFKPNNQVDGYVYAAQQLTGRPVAGALINAIAWYRVGKTKYERQVTTRTPADLEEWLRNMQASASEIEWHHKHNRWPMRKNSCVTKYGPCEFHHVDKLGNPHERDSVLNTDFVIEMWDYERREGTA